MRRGGSFVPRSTPGEFIPCGDSITNGYGNSAGASWREVVARILTAAGLRVTAYNGGHNGEKSADMLTRFAADVDAHYTGAGLLVRGHAATALLILAIGTNDAATAVSEGTARTNQNDWIDDARALGDVIIGTVAVLPRIATFSGGADAASHAVWAAANNAFRASQVGTREDVHVPVPAELTDASDTDMYPDGIHLSDAGALILGTAVAAAAIAAIGAT